MTLICRFVSWLVEGIPRVVVAWRHSGDALLVVWLWVLFDALEFLLRSFRLSRVSSEIWLSVGSMFETRPDVKGWELFWSSYRVWCQCMWLRWWIMISKIIISTHSSFIPHCSYTMIWRVVNTDKQIEKFQCCVITHGIPFRLENRTFYILKYKSPTSRRLSPPKSFIRIIFHHFLSARPFVLLNRHTWWERGM